METQTSTSKPFTRLTDETAFTRRHHRLHYTQVHVFHPPLSHSSDHRPWITAGETTANNTVIFRHPLTSKPHSFTFIKNLRLSELHPSIISLSYHLGESYPVDNLLVFPAGASSNFVNCYDSYSCALLASYGGGQLRGCPRVGPEKGGSVSDSSPWVQVAPYYNFDDITVFRGKIYSVRKEGRVASIHSYKTTRRFKMGAVITTLYVTPDLNQFGWRKRFVIHAENLYLVVRTAEKSFRVYKLKQEGNSPRRGFYWSECRGFDGKVLFMARDYYFIRKASRKFPGREYKNCIVFSEAGFPQYGNGCWEFTQSGDRQFSENDIAVFRLDDQAFAREGENSDFPKIDWSPPDWILNVSSIPVDQFKKHSESVSSSGSEREPDEDDGLDCDSGKKNDEEVQSDLKDTSSEDEEEQEEMETNFGCLDQDQDGMVSHSDSQDKEGDPVTLSISAVEGEVTRTPLTMNSKNVAIEEETSGENITHAIPKASTSSTTKSQKSDSATVKFEGLDIRSDLVPTLQKIWCKHGNIIKDSIVRSGDIVARALESLATMVQILEDNPVQSLIDSQADYLSSTLSDLRSIRFNVYWLVSFVEKALKVHESKSLVESFNNLRQLSSQVKERRAILLDEVAKLNEEENKLKKEMGKMSKMIPFSGQVKFDEPIGAGLT